MRKNSTLSEILLWNELKGKKMLGLEFHRQVPLDNFIVDFYCHELHLAIEIDGHSHNDKMLEDEVRQNRLESLGVRLLRFDDGQLKKDMTNVLRTILYWVEEKTSPYPPSKGEL